MESYEEYEPETVIEIVDNVAVTEVQMEINADEKKDDSLDVDEISTVVMKEDIIAVEYGIADVEAIAPEIVATEENFLIDQITYEEYKHMTPLEKAQSCGFTMQYVRHVA